MFILVIAWSTHFIEFFFNTLHFNTHSDSDLLIILLHLLCFPFNFFKIKAISFFWCPEGKQRTVHEIILPPSCWQLCWWTAPFSSRRCRDEMFFDILNRCLFCDKGSPDITHSHSLILGIHSWGVLFGNKQQYENPITHWYAFFSLHPLALCVSNCYTILHMKSLFAL